MNSSLQIVNRRRSVRLSVYEKPPLTEALFLTTYFIYICDDTIGGSGRSEWPRGLRHELSSLARKLGSWIQIPLNAWMSVCLFCVCVVLCVGSGLLTG
jgi:hypothetical protein